MATLNSTAPAATPSLPKAAAQRRAAGRRRSRAEAEPVDLATQQMLEGAEAFRRMAERISDEGYIIVEKGWNLPNDQRTDYMAADLAVVAAFSKVFGSQGFDAKQLGFMQALANVMTAENTNVLAGLDFENLDAAAMLSDCGSRSPEESITAAVGVAGVQQGAGGTDAQAEAHVGSGGDPGERAGALAFLRMLRAVRATPEIPMSDAVRKATHQDPGPDALTFDYAHADAAVAQCLRAVGTPDSPAARGLVKAIATHLVAQELVHAEYADADDETEIKFLLEANGFRDAGRANGRDAMAGANSSSREQHPIPGMVEPETYRAKHVLGLYLELHNDLWALGVALGNAIREECWNGTQHEDACPRLSLALSGMLEERLGRMDDTLAIGRALELSEATVKQLAYRKPQ